MGCFRRMLTKFPAARDSEGGRGGSVTGSKICDFFLVGTGSVP